MRKIIEIIKNVVGKMHNLPGRLLQPRPALQPAPARLRRVMRQK